MSARPELLFLSPVLPAETGNGLAMRAGIFLEAYARHFDVTVAVLHLFGKPPEGPLPDFLGRHAFRVEVLPLDRFLSPLTRLIALHRDPEARRDALRAYPWPRQALYDAESVLKALLPRLEGRPFSRMHAMRLYMAPLAEPWLGRIPCLMDMDEDEIGTRERLAALHEANDEAIAAASERMDAGKYATLERGFLARFDRSFLASPTEAGRLARRNPAARFAVVPNAVRPPSGPAAAADRRTIDFLLVGTLGYYPNLDAAAYFCREIRQHLVEAGRAPRIAIVGRNPPPSLSALAELPGVELCADVPDVAGYYAAAKVAVVPIRAGGGSRIKILEAFAHGVPVVSTTLGAEGLEVEHGRHLLLADGPEAFAAAAARLCDDRVLAAALAAAARRLLMERYSFAAVAPKLEALALAPAAMIDCAAENRTGPAEGGLHG